MKYTVRTSWGGERHVTTSDGVPGETHIHETRSLGELVATGDARWPVDQRCHITEKDFEAAAGLPGNARIRDKVIDVMPKIEADRKTERMDCSGGAGGGVSPFDQTHEFVSYALREKGEHYGAREHIAMDLKTGALLDVKDRHFYESEIGDAIGAGGKPVVSNWEWTPAQVLEDLRYAREDPGIGTGRVAAVQVSNQFVNSQMTGRNQSEHAAFQSPQTLGDTISAWEHHAADAADQDNSLLTTGNNGTWDGSW